MSVKSVLVHSCHIPPNGRPRDLLEPGELYVGELGIRIGDQEYYYPLPKKCRCKRHVTVSDATEFEAQGWAVWILQFKLKKGEIVLNDEVSTKIWMPVVRERVPRVDLISRADIERSVMGSERKSNHYKYDKTTKKYIAIHISPEGKTDKEWAIERDKEIKFENRIRRHFKQYIEECHKITMESRAKLIVPFIPDPFEGRVLFPFTPDMRTEGSYDRR